MIEKVLDLLNTVYWSVNMNCGTRSPEWRYYYGLLAMATCAISEFLGDPVYIVADKDYNHHVYSHATGKMIA